MPRLNPYERILRAAKAGTGVHLDAQEVRALAMDGAIGTRATEIEINPKAWPEQMKMSSPKPRYFGP